MKKSIIGLTLLATLAIPLVGLAQGAQPQPPGWDNVQLQDIFDRVFNGLFLILMIVAAIFLVIAGYFFVTAAGNPDSIKKARDFVLYALIGVAVAIAAKILVITVDRVIRPV